MVHARRSALTIGPSDSQTHPRSARCPSRPDYCSPRACEAAAPLYTDAMTAPGAIVTGIDATPTSRACAPRPRRFSRR
jgi:hypothetical protein